MPRKQERNDGAVVSVWMLELRISLCKLRSSCCDLPDALQVYIHVQSQARNSYHLGYFASEMEAAKAYDREILKVCMTGEMHCRLFWCDPPSTTYDPNI